MTLSLQPSANQFGSVDSGNAANGQIPLSDRSVTPLLQDFVDPSMCYLPNGYPSTAFYYGGQLIFEICAVILIIYDFRIFSLLLRSALFVIVLHG